jgi:hypothetical protein
VKSSLVFKLYMCVRVCVYVDLVNSYRIHLLSKKVSHLCPVFSVGCWSAVSVAILLEYKLSWMNLFLFAYWSLKHELELELYSSICIYVGYSYIMRFSVSLSIGNNEERCSYKYKCKLDCMHSQIFIDCK